MEKVSIKMLVYFDDPFWKGVYERTENNTLQVSQIIFGKEPKDMEIFWYLLRNWSNLRFSLCVRNDGKQQYIKNPKRLQRKINQQLKNNHCIGTKAQQALKLQQEQSKQIYKKIRKQKIQEEEEKKYSQKRNKKKQKHKGH